VINELALQSEGCPINPTGPEAENAPTAAVNATRS